ncbi:MULTISPECIES: DUF447 domain-containing protein [unclassified Xanthobacter]|uniref:DUF447 domain-containing protein n=1 Tax=unclassified Xanthobacter TaxID=2623496 RepID=UPI001EDD1A73
MIRETIVTTASPAGVAHIAPMGATLTAGGYLLLPFRPSRTLDNLLASGAGVLNFTDDARVFAGCVTGRRRDWPTLPAGASVRLADTLAHAEFVVEKVEDDPVRPRFHCRVVNSESHGLFQGLNRAVAAVVEGAVLVSRLHLLPADEVAREMARLAIAVEKTAGPAEQEAWGWLVDTVAAHRAQVAS